jgi:hypothetical protein
LLRESVKRKEIKRLSAAALIAAKNLQHGFPLFTEILIVADVSILQARGCMKFG